MGPVPQTFSGALSFFFRGGFHLQATSPSHPQNMGCPFFSFWVSRYSHVVRVTKTPGTNKQSSLSICYPPLGPDLHWKLLDLKMGPFLRPSPWKSTLGDRSAGGGDFRTSGTSGSRQERGGQRGCLRREASFATRGQFKRLGAPGSPHPHGIGGVEDRKNGTCPDPPPPNPPFPYGRGLRLAYSFLSKPDKEACTTQRCRERSGLLLSDASQSNWGGGCDVTHQDFVLAGWCIIAIV